MKQRIILISGFGGTGKTTAAIVLFNKLADCALVEADYLYVIKPWVIGEKLARIKLRNSLDVMHNFAHEGYPNIICVGLVWNQAEFEAVQTQFPKDVYDIICFWLTAKKDIRFARVIGRGDGKPDDTLDFLEHVEQTVPNPWPLRSASGHLEEIDTSNLNPEEIAQLMFERLAEN